MNVNSFQMKKQGGAALFVSLILLILLTVLGLSAAKRSTIQEKMATNVHIKEVAFSSAEMALSAFVNEKNSDSLPADSFLNILNRGDNQVAFYLNANGRPIEKTDSVTHRSSGTAQIIERCNVVFCTGFSLGSSPVGCTITEVKGKGTIGTVIGTNTLHLYQVSACRS